MTRFARIKGNKKPSFNKVFEEATSWEEMNQPVEENENECDDDDKEEKSVESKNVETPSKIKTKWCELEEYSNDEVNCKKGKKRKIGVTKDKNGCNNDKTEKQGKKYEKNKDKNNKKQKIILEENPSEKLEKIYLHKEKNILEEIPSENKKQKQKIRRKPDEGYQTMVIDDKEVKLCRFDGFYVKEEDVERLTKLREQLQSQGLPKERIKAMVKKERRNAERVLSKLRKKLCLHCRKPGHNLTTCPELSATGIPSAGVRLCYKCGSTEHNMFQCKVPGNELKFANCFVCKEQGHLSKNCPDNPRGLYPEGGGCRLCGDVTHLKRDCPKGLKHKNSQTVTVGTINNSVEGLDDEEPKQFNKNHGESNKSKKHKKIVKL